VPIVLGLEGADDVDRMIATWSAEDLEMFAAMDDADRERLEGFAATVRRAVDRVLSSSPEKRVAKIIERAAGVRCETLQGQATLVGRIVSFAAEAAECIERGDFQRLTAAIGSFDRAVRDDAAMAPPRPSLMPSQDAFYFAGWKTEEYTTLQNILRNRLCGVQKRDYCVSIDAKGARLASGKYLSREQIAEHVPGPGPKMFMVGSLPLVMATIAARRQS